MADLGFGIAVSGVSDAVSALQRVGQATTATAGATRSAGEAASGAANATGAFGSALQASVSRVAGMANQVASLSQRLGGGELGQAAGLVGSLAGVTANALAMGATLGPGGVVIGAVSGLVPILADLLGANEHLAVATSSVTEAQRNFTIEARGSVSAIDDLISSTRALAEQEERRRRISVGTGSAEEQFAAANLAGARIGTLSVERARVQDQLAEARRQAQLVSTSENDRAVQRLEEQSASLAQQIADAREESHRLGALAATAQSVEQASRQQQGLEAADARAQAEARRGDSAAAHAEAARAAQEHARAEEWLADLRHQADAEFAEEEDNRQAEHEAEIARQTEQAALLEAQKNKIQQTREEQRRADEQAAEAARQHLEEQQRLTEAAREASDAFSNGYVNSIDAVVTAWTHANVAIQAASGQMLSSSQLLERGMVAVGNNIAETVGGTMKGAFESALGAWLDGSKSFVQAAEEMAKGVLKALVTEAIVQGVVELARGIADLASYHYDSAALHFAAAGAWAAVGVVAGGVGAAVGAFGGGGQGSGQGGGATSRDTASASREQQSQQGGGTNIFYVYPGNVITRSDQAAAIQDVIDHGVRNGIIRRAA